MYKKIEVNTAEMGQNPFFTNFKFLARKINIKDKFKVDADGTFLPDYFFAEKDPNTKIFTKPENRIIICNMTSKAQRLFIWLCYEVESGKDWLWLNKKRYLKESPKTSLSTYKTALKELCRYGIICPTIYSRSGYYWINPELFFSGSRVDKLRDCMTISNPQD